MGGGGCVGVLTVFGGFGRSFTGLKPFLRRSLLALFEFFFFFEWICISAELHAVRDALQKTENLP